MCIEKKNIYSGYFYRKSSIELILVATKIPVIANLGFDFQQFSFGFPSVRLPKYIKQENKSIIQSKISIQIHN